MGATPRKRRPETAKARYERLGATGFLKPPHLWDVMMGRKRVHHGRNKREAHRAFTLWKRNAEHPNGQAYLQPISLLCDGERIIHHKPTTHP